MISFNDTLHLTKLYQDNKKQEILNFLSKKISFDNVIEFLDELKKLKFNLSTSHIKLNDNKREIILYNENFITNIPKIKSSEINLNDIIVTISLLKKYILMIQKLNLFLMQKQTIIFYHMI